jgi:hypothetical protein
VIVYYFFVGASITLQDVVVTNGGSGVAEHSFISGASGNVSIQNTTVGPLSFSGTERSLIEAGNGLVITIQGSNFTLLDSTSSSALIISDNFTDGTGSTTTTISNTSFTNLTV